MAKYKSTQNPSLPPPRERVCECIEPWKLGRVIIFRFEESTDLIEKERGRKRNIFFLEMKKKKKKERIAKEKEEEERKKMLKKREGEEERRK